jgi:transcriptional regulator with XRE-family HTH domain
MPVKEDRSVGWTKRSAAVSLLLAMENYRRETGLRVVQLREQRGWTQEDLAHAAEISVKTVSRLENGRHDGRRSTVERIAKALGVDEAALLGKPPAPLGLAAQPNGNGNGEDPAIAELAAAVKSLGDQMAEILRRLPPEDDPRPPRK